MEKSKDILSCSTSIFGDSDTGSDSNECECGISNYYACINCLSVVCEECCNKLHTIENCNSKTGKLKDLNKHVTREVNGLLAQLKDIQDEYDNLVEFIEPLLSYFGDSLEMQSESKLLEYRGELQLILTNVKKLYSATKENTPLLLTSVLEVEKLQKLIAELQTNVNEEVHEDLLTFMRERENTLQDNELLPSKFHTDLPQPVINWYNDYSTKKVLEHKIMEEMRDELNQHKKTIKRLEDKTQNLLKGLENERGLAVEPQLLLWGKIRNIWIDRIDNRCVYAQIEGYDSFKVNIDTLCIDRVSSSMYLFSNKTTITSDDEFALSDDNMHSPTTIDKKTGKELQVLPFWEGCCRISHPTIQYEDCKIEKRGYALVKAPII